MEPRQQTEWAHCARSTDPHLGHHASRHVIEMVAGAAFVGASADIGCLLEGVSAHPFKLGARPPLRQVRKLLSLQ